MGKLPSIRHTDAVRAFQKAGFDIIRQSGHVVMSDGSRTIIIPRNNPINAFTMYAIVQGSGLSVQQFRDLL